MAAGDSAARRSGRRTGRPGGRRSGGRTTPAGGQRSEIRRSPPGRDTNLALLVVLPLALLTGGLAFLLGSGPVRPVVVAHGLVGVAVLVLSPWKSAVARRGLRRPRPQRATSLLLALLVVVALVSGFAHSTGLLRQAFGITALQVHVGASLLAIVPLAAHVRRRPAKAGRRDLSRRSLLRAGLLGAGAAGVYAALAGAASAFALPGASRRATGSYELSSGNPAGMPVTSWLFDQVPRVDPSTWSLAVVSGGHTRRWSLAELSRSQDRTVAVLDCTGGWWSRQAYTGVRLSRLLPAGATGSVEVVSVTGYRRRLPLGQDLLLAWSAGGAPLGAGHGGPVRLVAPGRRGYHWVKWVTRVEHDPGPWWAEPPFPLQ